MHMLASRLTAYTSNAFCQILSQQVKGCTSALLAAPLARWMRRWLPAAPAVPAPAAPCHEAEHQPLDSLTLVSVVDRLLGPSQLPTARPEAAAVYMDVDYRLGSRGRSTGLNFRVASA